MKVEIITRENCKYCTWAKELLLNNSIVYIEYKIGQDITREEVRQKFSSAQTYPVILVNGEYIGGYTDLKAYFETNQT